MPEPERLHCGGCTCWRNPMYYSVAKFSAHKGHSLRPDWSMRGRNGNVLVRCVDCASWVVTPGRTLRHKKESKS